MNLYCRAPFSCLRVKENSFGICCVHHEYSKMPIDKYDTGALDEISNAILEGDIESLSTECKYCLARHKFDVPDNVVFENICRFTDNQKMKPYFLEIGLGNNCNNNCKYCDASVCKNVFVPKEDYIHCGHYRGKDIVLSENVMNLIRENGDSIRILEFVGGEPFLYMDKIYEILDICKNIKELRIITNASIFNKEFFDLLKDRKIKASITASIDGTPRTQKYLRGLSSYENVIDNVKKMMDYSNVVVSVNTTVSLLNIYDIEEVIYNINERLNNPNLCLLIVRYPTYYGLASVTNEEMLSSFRDIIGRLKTNGSKQLLEYLDDGYIDPIISKEEVLKVLNYHDERIKLKTKDYLHQDMYKYFKGEQ